MDYLMKFLETINRPLTIFEVAVVSLVLLTVMSAVLVGLGHLTKGTKAVRTSTIKNQKKNIDDTMKPTGPEGW